MATKLEKIMEKAEQALIEIAEQLTHISISDLTKCEKNIAKILVGQGVLEKRGDEYRHKA